ncbi:MAG: NAD(P)-dependent oxidoreductase [Caldilineaceae bacterium]|nr:NAD(P)-dependent oxidoreductase [Caldilineaceae bacterium]
MKVLILGGAGMLGPYVAPALEANYDLRVTDIAPPPMEFRGEFRRVDVADAKQVMEAAAGMDAIINLSVLRQDRKLAFEVNTLGCYNMMEAAVAHGIRRVINTGPHFTIAGPSYEQFDFDIGPEVPAQPGTNLYALSKSLGQEICRVYSRHHDVYVQTYLFYNFVDPAQPKHKAEVAPFAVSWQDAGRVFAYGLEIPLAQLPSRCEVFNVFADSPYGKFSNEKVKRILGWEAHDDISAIWRR